MVCLRLRFMQTIEPQNPHEGGAEETPPLVAAYAAVGAGSEQLATGDVAIRLWRGAA